MASFSASCSLVHGIVQSLRSWLIFLVYLVHSPKIDQKFYSILKFKDGNVLNGSKYNIQMGEKHNIEGDKRRESSAEGSKVTKSSESAFFLPEEYLLRVFNLFDRDFDGLISSEDIRSLLENLGLSVSSEYMDIAPEVIGFNGFLGLYNSLWNEYSSGEGDGEENGGECGELMQVFNVFDKDGDGYICASELHEILHSLGLKEGRDLSVCESMIRKVDTNFDGKVDFNEFKQMMLHI